jgi:hypothetical protein
MKAKAVAKKKASPAKAKPPQKIAVPPTAQPITHDDPNDRADEAVENAGEGAMDGTVVAEAVDSSWDASEGDATDQAQPA